jgi:hypothetical protein
MRAVNLILQEQAFTEHLDGKIVFEIQTDKDGNYLGANKPIVIAEVPIAPKKVGRSLVCSVTTFLSYDPKEAAKNGGTWEALEKTLEREPNVKDLFAVKDFKTMEIAFSELASYLETVSEDEKLEKAFYAYLKKAGNGALVSSMFKVANALDDVVVKPDLQQINNAVAA